MTKWASLPKFSLQGEPLGAGFQEKSWMSKIPLVIALQLTMD